MTRCSLALSLVCCALFEGCTWNAESERAEPNRQQSSVPAQRSEYRAEADFGTLDTQLGNRISVGFSEPEVTVGFFFAQVDRPGPAVMQFPALDIDARCITRAELQVTLAGAPPNVPLVAYPARPDSLPAHEGGEIPSWGLLVDNRPRGVFHMQGDIAEAEVTELVKLWVTGGSFPSRRLTVDPDAPVSIVVQPEAATEDTTTRIFTSESGDTTTPRLRVEASC